ncbi:MAG: hypothetical protein WCA24_07210, partial [Thiomonas sp.]
MQKTTLRAAFVSMGMSMALYAAAPQAAEPAAASAPPVNLQSASITDLPGSPSRVHIDPSLGVHTITIRDGAVVLDSAVLLKVYVYAYSGQPLSYTDILTANTEMIVPPAPVQATQREKQQIDAMIAFAKTHPKLLIQVEDIALDAYVAANHEYPLDNRLFIHGAGYYFDNSPYHYTYDHPEAFRHLQCTDADTMKAINQAIDNYVHFHMGIACTVMGADAKTHALQLRVDETQLKDALGNVL